MDAPFLGVYVAAAGIVVSAVLSIVESRRQSRSAAASALRAEAAGRVSDYNAQRIISALERLADSAAGSRPAVLFEPVPRVVWQLAPRDAGYELTNTGTGTAADVRIRLPASLPGRTPAEARPVAPGESLAFTAAPDRLTTDATVTVAWRDPDGTDREWFYPLPPAA
ncbi:hypothetical protein LVY72_17080 [Arthrobacter sp. I2-34]|uniref:Uncharacterized protein n=1 Tax=Arthrobacter hankyongi TaxID=2904801 RepID=A0ABS9LAS4_9MICC|nr:hypothetical protein [Arthrobacter hankyongi]MCG2623613.1 hypothetical protein [Arthrobacter hankyongi]